LIVVCSTFDFAGVVVQLLVVGRWTRRRKVLVDIRGGELGESLGFAGGEPLWGCLRCCTARLSGRLSRVNGYASAGGGLSLTIGDSLRPVDGGGVHNGSSDLPLVVTVLLDKEEVIHPIGIVGMVSWMQGCAVGACAAAVVIVARRGQWRPRR
jgi:hypothetical protein